VYPENLHKALDPRRWLFFLIYLPYFLYYCVKANIDVMFRVIHPDIPIRPGIIKVRTTLTTDMAKTFLANSITLTPGTLTIDIDGQDLYIHWINIHTDDTEKRTAEICERFEPLLRRIFE
jgi:multicomponent Na+:H+ antiporter subunit E